MKWDVILGIASGIGLCHALLLGVFLIRSSKGNHAANVILAMILFSFAVRIFKSTFFAVLGFTPDFLPTVGLMAMSCSGPLIYIYVRLLLSKPIALKQTIPHFGWITLATLNLFIANDTFERVSYLVVILSTFGYVFSAFTYTKKLKDQVSKAWMICLLLAYTLIELVYLLQWSRLELMAYVIATTASSMVLLTLTYLCLIRFDLKKVHHARLGKPDSENESVLRHLVRERIVTNQEFKDAELTVARLAQRMSVTPAQVSIAIRKEFGMTFPELLSDLRLKYVVNQLEVPGNPEKVESIAFDAGYQSPSSFYSQFKKVYHMTPTQYRDRTGALVQQSNFRLQN